jgi:hypothetical protein
VDDFASAWQQQLQILRMRTGGIGSALESSLNSAKAYVDQNKDKMKEDKEGYEKNKEYKRVDDDLKKANGLLMDTNEKDKEKKLRTQIQELEKKRIRIIEKYREDKKKDNKTKEKPGLGFPLTSNYEGAVTQVKEAVRQYLAALDGLSRDLAAKGFEISAEDAKEAKRRIEAKIPAVLMEVSSVIANNITASTSQPGDVIDVNLSVSLFRRLLMEDGRTAKNLPASAQAAAFEKLREIDVKIAQSFSAFGVVIRTKHIAVIKAVTSKHTAASALASEAVMPLYFLKAMRVGSAYAAAYVAARLFENVYIGSMAAAKPAVPDLKWMVVAFTAFQLLFDGALLAMLWLVRRFDIGGVSVGLAKDFAVDTFVASVLSLSSLLWMADVVQDRRYFEYQLAAPRALRVMRQLCFGVAGVHACVPYFYFSGPFFLFKQRSTETRLLKKQPTPGA